VKLKFSQSEFNLKMDVYAIFMLERNRPKFFCSSFC